MSDDPRKLQSTPAVAGEPAPDAGGYEPPTLTHVGNARDLLAGSNGTVTDVAPVGPRVTQNG